MCAFLPIYLWLHLELTETGVVRSRGKSFRMPCPMVSQCLALLCLQVLLACPQHGWVVSLVALRVVIRVMTLSGLFVCFTVCRWSKMCLVGCLSFKNYVMYTSVKTWMSKWNGTKIPSYYCGKYENLLRVLMYYIKSFLCSKLIRFQNFEVFGNTTRVTITNSLLMTDLCLDRHAVGKWEWYVLCGWLKRPVICLFIPLGLTRTAVALFHALSCNRLCQMVRLFIKVCHIMPWHWSHGCEWWLLVCLNFNVEVVYLLWLLRWC